MARQKVRFNNMFQFQNDNLNGYKQYTTNRTIINSNISINPSNIFGIDLNYSSYGMNQTRKQPKAADSIKINQQSSGITLVPHLVITGAKMTHIINLVASYTTVNGGGVLKGDSNKVNNYYATLTNTMSFNRGGWGASAGVNYNNASTYISRLRTMA